MIWYRAAAQRLSHTPRLYRFTVEMISVEEQSPNYLSGP